MIKNLIESKKQAKRDKAIEEEVSNLKTSLMEVKTWSDISEWLDEFEEATVEVNGMFFAEYGMMSEFLAIHFFTSLGDLTVEYGLESPPTHTKEQKAWTRGWNEALENVMDNYRSNVTFEILNKEV